MSLQTQAEPPADDTAAEKPTLFLLHALGGSARAWEGVVAALGTGFQCVPLDLPGFGDRAGDADMSVEFMLDWLAGQVRRRDPAAWMVVGHSMGGKLATLIAARANAGEAGLSALAGVVLLAGSPPAPEPMDEERRAEMIGWFADGGPTAEQAAKFVDANTAARLPDDLRGQAVEDVRRTSRQAWLDWLERGSREDWSDVAGAISVPALVVAGAKDEDLGEDAQRRLNVPHYPEAELASVADAKHLLPLEQPQAVAALIAGHWARVSGRVLPPAFARLLASNRVSVRTRRVMLDRMAPASPVATALTGDQLATLRALVDCVLPGRAEGIDLAGRLDAKLAADDGDGWRFADLPPDREAWMRGLDTLDQLAGGFAALPSSRQGEWLARVAAGQVGINGDDRLSAGQMRLWFQDVCAEAVRAWLSDPRAQARIGYDGFANGGDGVRKQGYTRTVADDIEGWQLRREGISR